MPGRLALHCGRSNHLCTLFLLRLWAPWIAGNADCAKGDALSAVLDERILVHRQVVYLDAAPLETEVVIASQLPSSSADERGAWLIAIPTDIPAAHRQLGARPMMFSQWVMGRRITPIAQQPDSPQTSSRALDLPQRADRHATRIISASSGKHEAAQRVVYPRPDERFFPPAEPSACQKLACQSIIHVTVFPPFVGCCWITFLWIYSIILPSIAYLL